MGRRELPQALTLERFAAGKDGRAKAFKKKKQANKRKLFEKAQLKRQYAKLLRKDAANGGLSAQPPVHIETADVDTSPQPKNEAESGPPAPTVGNKEKKGAERRVRRQRQDGHEEGAREHNTLETTNTKSGKIRREHRPDPFKEAKATADQRRQEAEDKHLEREKQKTEKEDRAKKRRKQHALLSKRTRGGQPVMKHTIQHLLEKIQSQG